MSEQNPAPEEGQASERNDAPEGNHEGESFGSWLRGQREVRGVDLETIAQSSKINIRYLELLEEDRFDLLPASIFVRGFLREYARIVGLDADEVLNFHHVASAAAEHERPAEESARNPGSTWLAGRTVAVLVALAVLAAAIVWFSGRDRDSGEVLEAMAPPVTEIAPELPPTDSVPERPLRVTMEFRGTSWVDVYVDGERSVSELRVQGESLTVGADEEVRLMLSSVAVTTIEVNGEILEHGAADDEEIVISVPRPEAGP